MSQTRAQLINPLGTLTGLGLQVSGIVTAANFIGDGSGLTGVVGSGSGVIIEDSGSSVGTAGTINFGSGIDVSQISVGIVTVTSGVPHFIKTSAGIHTLGSVGIGTTNPTSALQVAGTVSAQDFNTTSDQSLKTNIVTIEDALEKIELIRGVEFNWVESPQMPSMGVIAQEVESVFPELVADTNPKQVNYNGLIGVLIESVKALKADNETLRAMLEDMALKIG
tara:strand:+ start:122 stop:790 length:669 start_codon:yes stop_codon:yes gene_type:complete